MTLYIEFIRPGTLFSTSSVKEAADKTPPPEEYDCEGFRFFERKKHQATRDDGVVFQVDGERENVTPWTYWGVRHSLADVEDLAKHNPNRFDILASNMKINEWHSVVRTRIGRWLALNEGDTVLPSTLPGGTP